MGDQSGYRSDPDRGMIQSRVESKKQYRRHETKMWVISLVAAVVIALTLRFFVFEFVRVDGPSMEPTLYSEEYVFMERVTYWFRTPERGDVVVCLFPGSSATYIKRVIGLPGERVKVEDGTLYIDGAANYDYFSGRMREDFAETTVPEMSVLVMGDNRNDSEDSRMVGPIAYKDIIGRAVSVIWPFDKINGL